MKLIIENFKHLGILEEILRKMIEELEKVSESSPVSKGKLEVCEGVMEVLNINPHVIDNLEIEFGCGQEEEVIEELLEEDARLRLPKAIWPPVPGNTSMRKDLCEIADAKADDES